MERMGIPARILAVLDKTQAHEIQISVADAFADTLVSAFEGLGLDVGTDADYGRNGYTKVVLRDRSWSQAPPSKALEKYEQSFSNLEPCPGEAEWVDRNRKDAPMRMDWSGYDPATYALELASKSPQGMAWAISDDMADDIIRKYRIILSTDPEKAGGPMVSGDKGAVLTFMPPGDTQGVTMRLVKRWTGKWELFKGLWKPDPHWRGD